MENNLQYGAAIQITRLVPQFMIKDYATVKLIDGIMESLIKVKSAQTEQLQAIYESHGLPLDESIDASHPLYRQISEEIYTAPSPFTRAELQRLTIDQFNACLHGLTLSYQDRKLLEYWLVITE